MTRFALISLLAALPFAVVAAPVPHPPAPPPFGTNGIVPRAELDALTFDSRAVPAGELKRDRVERVKRLVELRKVQAVEAPNGPPKVRPANRYDVAVHMPAVRFHVGEPIPAFFVVRNNRDEDLGLDGRLDFYDGAPMVNNDCDLRLTDARTGKPVAGERQLKTIKCGGSEELMIPADGFYCAKGDLGPLPAGEYAVDWRCGEFRSAPVRFRVFDRDGPARPAARSTRAGYRFFQLGDNWERERASSEDDTAPIRRFVSLDPIGADDTRAALASGEGTDSAAFVPDVRDIPVRDKHVFVSVDWHPYRSGDSVTVTLRAAPPFKTVRFEELPQLFLQVEVPDARQRFARHRGEVSKKLAREVNYVTPLSIEAHFPEGWREELGSGETARVAVLVTAREVRLPDTRDRALMDRLDRVRFEHPECPTWRGVVRSEFAELRLPPGLP